MSAADSHNLGRAPLLGFGLLLVACAVLGLQQWLLHGERQRHHERGRACDECPMPATE